MRCASHWIRPASLTSTSTERYLHQTRFSLLRIAFKLHTLKAYTPLFNRADQSATRTASTIALTINSPWSLPDFDTSNTRIYEFDKVKIETAAFMGGCF